MTDFLIWLAALAVGAILLIGALRVWPLAALLGVVGLAMSGWSGCVMALMVAGVIGCIVEGVRHGVG